MDSSGNGKPKTSKPFSRSVRAALHFPDGRIVRFLKIGKYAERISSSSLVYLATVLDYLLLVLDLAGSEVKANKKKRIGPRQIAQAVRNDKELNQLLRDVTIPCSGEEPKTQPDL